MSRISTDKLQPGMVLADDVKDLSGRMLLTCGTAIQEKHLRVLRTWGILGVEVEGEGESEAEIFSLDDLPAEAVAKIEAELEKRFTGVDLSHPVMSCLADLAKADLIGRYQGNGENG